MATVRWCREAVAIVANTHHSFLFRRSLVLVQRSPEKGIESVKTNAASAAVVDLTE
jgi:hypothetical protein